MKRDDVPESKTDEGETRFIERRSGEDRRRTEVSTMGPLDRRKRVEPRKIQVVEVEMSESEWEALFGKRER